MQTYSQLCCLYRKLFMSPYSPYWYKFDAEYLPNFEYEQWARLRKDPRMKCKYSCWSSYCQWSSSHVRGSEARGCVGVTTYDCRRWKILGYRGNRSLLAFALLAQGGESRLRVRNCQNVVCNNIYYRLLSNAFTHLRGLENSWKSMVAFSH